MADICGTKHNVLVADANPRVRTAIVETLSPDYTVTEAASGDDAITHLVAGSFELITLDISTGTEDSGWETLRIITDEENGWPELKIVVLTTSRAPESVLKAWNLGASYYMTKPFSTVQLAKIVYQTLHPKAEDAN